jgi:hypothetical protein
VKLLRLSSAFFYDFVVFVVILASCKDCPQYPPLSKYPIISNVED